MHDDHTKSKDCKNSHEIYRNEGKEMREREIIKTEIGKHFFSHTRASDCLLQEFLVISLGSFTLL